MIIAHLLAIIIILLTVTVVLSSQDMKRVSNHTEPVTQATTTKFGMTTVVTTETSTARTTSRTATGNSTMTTSATTTVKSTQHDTVTLTTPQKATVAVAVESAVSKDTSEKQTTLIEQISTTSNTIIESIIEQYDDFSDDTETSLEMSGYEATAEPIETATTAEPPATVLARVFETLIGQDRCQKYNGASIQRKHSLLYRYPKRYRRCRKRLNYLG